MNKENVAPTKICQNCGQQKPLDTFVPYTDPTGHKIYGNICADCRQSIKEGDKREEGSSRSNPGGAGLRNNERFKIQQDEKEKTRDINERYYHDRDEKHLAQDKTAEKEAKIRQALKHDSLFTRQNNANKQTAQPITPNAAQTNAARERPPGASEDVLKDSNTQAPTMRTQSAALQIFAAQHPDAPVSRIFSNAQESSAQESSAQKEPLVKMFTQALQKPPSRSHLNLNKPSEKPAETHTPTPTLEPHGRRRR